MQLNGNNEKLPDYPWIRDSFNIHSTPSYTKHYMGKFSSLQDVNNGFILDGILGDYKEGELPLAQQHLNNIEHLINPQKSIFLFDRILQCNGIICTNNRNGFIFSCYIKKRIIQKRKK